MSSKPPRLHPDLHVYTFIHDMVGVFSSVCVCRVSTRHDTGMMISCLSWLIVPMASFLNMWLGWVMRHTVRWLWHTVPCMHIYNNLKTWLILSSKWQRVHPDLHMYTYMYVCFKDLFKDLINFVLKTATTSSWPSHMHTFMYVCEAQD